MIQFLAATLMWGLVLCLLPGIQRRADQSIVVAAVTIAAALTLNVDRVYSAGDALLGGRNVLDLGANILMVVGIYFLSRAILRAADPDDIPSGHDRLGIAVLGLVIAGLIVCFSLIEAPYSSTTFMKDFGDQWSAATYSALQFVYIGAVVSVTGYTCFRFRGDMSRPYFRVAFTLIGVGCSLAVVLVLAVLGMDVLHLQGDLAGMYALSVVYDGAFIGAMAFLCVGLALPPMARRLQRIKDSKAEASLVSGLTEVWERMTESMPEIRLVSAVPADRQKSARWRLHRMLVEVQDALLMDPGLSKTLDEGDRRLLERVERYLAAGPGGRADRADPRPTRKGERTS
ncbi:DUF6545 domain-containing protein [Pseudarthrobacter sp. DSP2-3-2b1]|uniref:DUF6545 domain-containing protein n=1 Tax=Pseudarthrobacter sp. DSP2-3-2b1 TaxID=2804661 RepID=UPI003CFA230E